MGDKSDTWITACIASIWKMKLGDNIILAHKERSLGNDNCTELT